MGDLELWLYHYSLCATLADSLHSLGLGMARRVAGPVYD
jgi:hypothetical protein